MKSGWRPWLANQDQENDLIAFELAQELAKRSSIVSTYVIRAINQCVDRGLLHAVQRSNVYITQNGHANCGRIDVTEEELRERFESLQNIGHVHESLEFEHVFNGIIGRGEVIH